MDPILGQIILWPVPWVPDGWALCDGSLLSVNQYQALFSLIGKLYGGDGVNNFALPDLRYKVPVGTQTMQSVAQTGGSPTSSVTATGAGSLSIGINNMPSHTHAATFTPSGGGASANIAIPAVSASAASTNMPGTSVTMAQTTGPAAKIYSNGTPDTTLKPFSVPVPAGSGTVTNASTGSGQPLPVAVNVPVTVSTLQPYLTLNYIIAVTGVYPNRP